MVEQNRLSRNVIKQCHHVNLEHKAHGNMDAVTKTVVPGNLLDCSK